MGSSVLAPCAGLWHEGMLRSSESCAMLETEHKGEMSGKEMVQKKAAGLWVALPAGMLPQNALERPRAWRSAGYDASSRTPRRGSTRRLPPKSFIFLNSQPSWSCLL